MTDQEHLEKMNYWDEDNEVSTQYKTFLQGKTVFNYKKKRTREDRLNTFLPKVAKIKTPVKRLSNLKTGWSGIENYIKQCQNSENRN